MAQKRKVKKQNIDSLDITARNGLYEDLNRWLNLFIISIEHSVENKKMSLNTHRSYVFFKKSILIYTKREFDVKTGIDKLDELFLNGFLDWISRYKYSVKYGSDKYFLGMLYQFVQYAKKREEDIYEILNMYAKDVLSEESEEYNNKVDILENFIIFIETQLEKDITLCRKNDMKRYIKQEKESNHSGYQIISQNSSMKQRKAILTSFLSFVSESNSQKHNFDALCKKISVYNIETMTHDKNSNLDLNVDILAVDKLLRGYAEKRKYTKLHRVSKIKEYSASRDALLGLIMLYTGLRFHEVVSLSYDDVIHNDEVYIIAAKNSMGEKIHIKSTLINKEFENLKSYGFKTLGSTYSGKQLDYASLYRSLARVFEGSDIKFKGLRFFCDIFERDIFRKRSLLKIF